MLMELVFYEVVNQSPPVMILSERSVDAPNPFSAVGDTGTVYLFDTREPFDEVAFDDAKRRADIAGDRIYQDLLASYWRSYGPREIREGSGVFTDIYSGHSTESDSFFNHR